jgi:hypothetical protein
MRTLRFISTDAHNDPPELHPPALTYRQGVWNALISSLKLYINYKLITQHLTGSRTLGTINLCAIVPARRLYGN